MTSVAGNRVAFDPKSQLVDFGKGQPPVPPSAKQMAELILGDAAPVMSSVLIVGKAPTGAAPRNMDKIEAALDLIAGTSPKLAAATRAEIMSRFSPVEQGELLRRQDGVMKMGPDGAGFNFAEPGKGVSQEDWIAAAKAGAYADYGRYVQLAGSEDVGAIKKTMNDVFEGRAVLPQVAAEGEPNPPGSGWSMASEAIGAVDTANTFVVGPAANFLSEAMDSHTLLKGSLIAGRVLPVAGLGSQYMENRANNHSRFASGVGAGASTVGPVLAGAAAGAGAGVFFKGVGALPGAVGGAYFGYVYGDKINASGLSTAEFIENKITNVDLTRLEDSKGVSLGSALEKWFSPPTGVFGK